MNRRPLAVGILVCAAAGVLGPSLDAIERLSMRVSPSVAFAPANLRVKAVVEVHKDNRSIEIIAESDNFYRSSEIPLEGDLAPRTTMFRLSNLPGGRYVVRAVLRGAGGQAIAASEADLNVVDLGAGH